MWMKVAHRDDWKHVGETIVQKWTVNGYKSINDYNDI